jgi:phosphodiesterase/alkaline phosphatase D-like protein
LQVHIAFAGADANGYPDAMSIMWQTENQTATSTCQYSTSPSMADAVTVSGTQSSYYQSWQHVARTNTLQASTQYYYTCGDATAGMSPVFNFTSGAGAAQRNVTILQVGDMGVYESYYTRQLIDQLAPEADMLLWSGDICYADDAFLHDPVGFGYEETYDVCQTWLQNVTTFLPFMVAPGNHEAECHSPACLLDDERKEKLHNFSAYNHRFTMPSDVSSPNPGVLNQWYR